MITMPLSRSITAAQAITASASAATEPYRWSAQKHILDIAGHYYADYEAFRRNINIARQHGNDHFPPPTYTYFRFAARHYA